MNQIFWIRSCVALVAAVILIIACACLAVRGSLR